MSRLAELVVPADSGGGSAVDAGAPELIDLLCSQNQQIADIYTGGVSWLDATIRSRFGKEFLDASEQEQTGMLDTLVEEDSAGGSQGARDGTLRPLSRLLGLGPAEVRRRDRILRLGGKMSVDAY